MTWNRTAGQVGENGAGVWAENKAKGQQLSPTGCWPPGLGKGYLYAGASWGLGWGDKLGVSISPLQ